MATNRWTVPNTFANASSPLPLANLDQDFSTGQSFANDSSLGFCNYAGTDVGSANIYNVTLPYGVPSAYNQGMFLVFKPANTNTGASTVTVPPLGSVAIVHSDGSALTGGEIQANVITAMVFNGTSFVLLGTLSNVSGAGLEQAPYAGARFKDNFVTTANWSATLNGGGSSFGNSNVTVDATNKGFGVASGSTGGVIPTGYSIAFPASAGQTLFPGLGPLEVDVRISLSALGSASQNFNCYFGIADAINLNNAILIGNSFNISSVNWVGLCTSAASSTTTNGVAMTAGTYHKLQILVNAAWNSVTFFADGVQVGSAITTNIPVVAMSPVLYVAKSVGTTAVGYFIDDYFLDYRYAK
jgi:hypothetical protein